VSRWRRRTMTIRPPRRSGARGTIRDTITAEAGREKNPGLNRAKPLSGSQPAGSEPGCAVPILFRQEITLPVRLSPPALQVISTQTYVAQGGLRGGCVPCG